MKVNIEIECTPGEARAFMGLPDVEAANAAYAEAMAKSIGAAGNPEKLGEYAAAMAPMGQAGLALFRNLMESGMGGAGGASGAKSPSGSSSGSSSTDGD